MAFIELAKVRGANALLGLFRHRGGFDRTLEGLEVTRVDSGAGRVEARMEVRAAHANAFGTLHGGCAGLLVDVLGTMALLSQGGVSRQGSKDRPLLIRLSLSLFARSAASRSICRTQFLLLSRCAQGRTDYHRRTRAQDGQATRIHRGGHLRRAGSHMRHWPPHQGFCMRFGLQVSEQNREMAGHGDDKLHVAFRPDYQLLVIFFLWRMEW